MRFYCIVPAFICHLITIPFYNLVLSFSHIYYKIVSSVFVVSMLCMNFAKIHLSMDVSISDILDKLVELIGDIPRKKNKSIL